MASNPISISVTAKLHLYKLDTTFRGDTTIHTNSLLPGMPPPRMVTVTTSWKRNKKLGSGAFGVVWREKEKKTGQLRAVKVISRLQLNEREVQALVDLQDHPKLFILFLGWFEDPHAFYIAMEYIPHGDLAQYIMKDGEKAATEVRQITSQILEGLVVLHNREICHRDLKPQNILIASPSPIWIKITDFGVSKQAVDTDLRTNTGTLSYRAPEQLGLLPRSMRDVGTYTKLVDIWALGIIVHEIICSEIPFRETSLGLDSLSLTSEPSTASTISTTVDPELLYQYCHGSEFPSESLRSRGVGEDGIDFVKRLMTVNPKKRISAADASECLWLVDPKIIRKFAQLRTECELLVVTISPETTRRLYEADNPTAIIEILGSPDMQLMQRTAVTEGFVEALTVILRVTDDIDSGAGLLQLAAGHGQCDVIELLLESGAAVNTMSAGQTALHAAAAAGHLFAMELLLKKGAIVDKYPLTENGQLPLHAAAAGGHCEAIKFLLDNKANVDGFATTENGQIPLSAAAAGGHCEAIKLLLDMGAGVNWAACTTYGQGALHAASGAGHLDAINLLLDRGAGVNWAACTTYGQRPLHAAAAGGHRDALDRLLQAGANVGGYVSNSKNGQTALHAAAAGGHCEAISILLENGADVDGFAPNKQGERPLHAAAVGGHHDALVLLLEAGANVDGYVSKSKNGETALHAAARGGHGPAVKCLLQSGATVDMGNSAGETALQMAALAGHIHAMQLLLDGGADLNGERMTVFAKPKAWLGTLRSSPLRSSVLGGHLDAVKFLLDKGAVSNQWALSATRDPAIVELLKNRE